MSKKTAAAKSAVKTAVTKIAQRARFVSKSKTQRLDIQLRSVTKGFKVSVVLKKPDTKAASGMPAVFTTQTEAVKKYDELVAMAKKNGWEPKQQVTRSSFDTMPVPDAA